MVKGDQFRCDWCTYSWKSKSLVEPFKCPSCESNNIINEAKAYRKILGNENIVILNKKKQKINRELVSKNEEVKEGFLDKISKIFGKK